MSKLDQLRRQREEQHARQQEQAAPSKAAISPAKAVRSSASAPEGEPAVPPEPAAAPALASRKPKGAADALEGDCSVCGKTRPLANGLVSNHQKGFGKMCAGSRKEPK